jgi:hypothetical protein
VKHITALFPIVMLALSFNLWASGEIVGNVVMLKGQAQVIPYGTIEQKKLNMGDKISRGDSIQTKPQSIIKIEMIDATVLVFGPNSKFNLREFVYTENKVRKGKIELVQGQMRAKFSHVQKGENDVQIHTKSVSLGIRGTEVLVNHLAGKNGKFQTQASLLSGQAVLQDKLSKKLLELFPGSVFVADSGRSGQMIQNYIPKDKLERLDRGLKLPGFDPNASEFALADSKDDKTDERSVQELTEELFLSSEPIALPTKKKSSKSKK